MLRRTFEPPACWLLLEFALGDGNSRECPRRGRFGADAAVVAVDSEDAMVVKMEAGSLLRSNPHATCPPASVSLCCDSDRGSWGWP
jgi:hypothetical protein